ncbi:MAG: hypothetical protein C4320_03820 [Armatimonadota bacterium]
MASSAARAGRAMFLDTRTLEIAYEPLDPEITIVLLDTQTPRTLAGSAYNERRAECGEACRILGVAVLRDAVPDQLVAHQSRMPEVVFRRARHVLTENRRVLDFREALATNDRRRIGELMMASHHSLRDDYEVTSPALDAMADAAWASPGVIGARMTGAGFGGCCVALVESDAAAEFAAAALSAYGQATGSSGRAIPCRPAAGASVAF